MAACSLGTMLWLTELSFRVPQPGQGNHPPWGPLHGGARMAITTHPPTMLARAGWSPGAGATSLRLRNVKKPLCCCSTLTRALMRGQAIAGCLGPTRRGYSTSLLDSNLPYP